MASLPSVIVVTNTIFSCSEEEGDLPKFAAPSLSLCPKTDWSMLNPLISMSARLEKREPKRSLALKKSAEV